MFNTYHAGTIKINAVTGAILKNHPKSWFERFHLNSARARELFVEGGHKYYEGNKIKNTIILQMVICGDMEVMAELVDANDYNMEIEQK